MVDGCTPSTDDVRHRSAMGYLAVGAIAEARESLHSVLPRDSQRIVSGGGTLFPLDESLIGLVETWYAGGTVVCSSNGRPVAGRLSVRVAAGGSASQSCARSLREQLRAQERSESGVTLATIVDIFENVPEIWRQCIGSGATRMPSHLFVSPWMNVCSTWDAGRAFVALCEACPRPAAVGLASVSVPYLLAQLPRCVIGAMLAVGDAIRSMVDYPNPILSGVAIAKVQSSLAAYGAFSEALSALLLGVSPTPLRTGRGGVARAVELQRCAFVMVLDGICQNLITTARVFFGDVAAVPAYCDGLMASGSHRAPSMLGIKSYSPHGSFRGDALGVSRVSSDNLPSGDGMGVKGGFFSSLFSKKSTQQPSPSASPSRDGAGRQGGTPSRLLGGAALSTPAGHHAYDSTPFLMPEGFGARQEAIVSQRLAALRSLLESEGDGPSVVGVVVRTQSLAERPATRCWERSAFSSSVQSIHSSEGDGGGGLSDHVWCSWYPPRLPDAQYRTLLASAAWRIMEMAVSEKTTGEDWDGEGRIIFCLSPETCAVRDAPFVMVARSGAHEACGSPSRFGTLVDSALSSNGGGDTPRSASTHSNMTTVTAIVTPEEAKHARELRGQAARRLIEGTASRVRSALGDLYDCLMLSWVPEALVFVD